MPPPTAPLPQAIQAALRRSLGEDGLLTDAVALERYARDETEDHYFPAAAVALPVDRDQVMEVMRLATRHRFPVTPRGGGTGLSGGALPVAGGLVLSLERMRRFRRLDLVNQLVEVEAGVPTGEIHRRVAAEGLYYPPDPASHETCLIGGNLAEDSAGPRSCRYGSTRRWVLGLEAVLADGRLMRTGGDTRKNVAGYDLTQLLVGSEGTLAVITAATLRLRSAPGALLTLGAPFPRLEDAARFVATIFDEGHDPAACELIDAAALETVAVLEPPPAAIAGCGALILLELHGDRMEPLLERSAELAALAEAAGGGELLVAEDRRERERLWRLRERIAEALRQRSVFKEADTVVPRSALAELVREARRIAAGNGLEAVCFGHAGDGNLHVNLLRGDLHEADWRRRRDLSERELFEAVVALGGTITGEHGVGWTQRRYLELAVDRPALACMRVLKQAFDPLGILNPGKIFAEAEVESVADDH